MSSNNLILGSGILLKNSSDGNTTLTLVSDVPFKNNSVVNGGENLDTSLVVQNSSGLLYNNIIISPEILNPKTDNISESIGPTGPEASVITGITLLNPTGSKTQISLANSKDTIDEIEEYMGVFGPPEAFSIVGPGLNIINTSKGETNISLVVPEPMTLSSQPSGSRGTVNPCGPCNPCPPVVETPYGSLLFSTIQLGNPSQGTQVTISTDGINLYLKPSGGNLYTGWTGTIIGSGGGGTGFTGPTGPAGSFDYRICPPPFEFGLPRSTAANIYIPIIYPDQNYVGDFPQPIPTIESTVLDLSYINGSNAIVSGTILDTGDVPFDPNYQNGLSSSSRSKPYANFPLEGVILNNSIEDPQTNPVKPIAGYNTFYDSSNTPYTVWSIVYYINDPKISSTGNSMTGTYTNYSDCIIPDNVIFDGFLPPTPPSNDAAYTPIPSGYTYSEYDRIALNILPPSDPDLGDNPGVFIKRYTSTYYTTGSTIRYPGPISQASAGSPLSQVVPYTTGAPVGTPFNTITNTGIYPDTLYTFNLTSTNSIGGTSDLCYGVTGRPSPPNYPTTYLPLLVYPTPGPNSLDISDYSSAAAFFATSFVGNAYLVSNGTQITKLFNKTAIVTNSFGAFSVNYDPSTRGLLGSGKTLMNIDTNTSTSSTINFNTNQNYQSFPLASATTSGTTLSMSSSSTSDQYSSPSAYQGFYSKVTVNNITLLIDAYSASNILRTFNAIQKYYQANGTTLANTYTTSQSFYYDQIVGPPEINSVSAVLVSATNYVSGVSIVATNPTFRVNTSALNMGDYFYHSPLLTYTFGGSASGTVTEPNLANLTSSISGGAFVEPVTFQNNNVSGTINPDYGKDIEIRVNAFNIVTSTASFSLANVDKQGIYDYPSYNLVYLSGNVPTTIQHLLVGSTYPVALGCRVWSAPMSTPVNLSPIANAIPPPYGHTNSSTLYSYSQFIYNQEWNITKTNTSITTPFVGTINTSNELQIFDGAYQSVDSTPGDKGYFDYSNRFANLGINYEVSTGPPEYRYATFVWKFENNADAPTQASTFTFLFKNFKCGGSIPTIGYDSSTGSFYISNNGNTQRLLFHYRVEQYDGSTIYVNPLPSDTSKITTLWTDGNSNYATTNIGGTATLSSNPIDPVAIDSGNYSTPADNSIVRDVASNSFSVVGNDLQVKLGNIIFVQELTNKCYVYARIGLPMIDNYSFEYVTLQITQ